MNKVIFQVILVVVSVGLFFTVVDPLYRSEDSEKPGIKSLQASISKYNEAIDKSEELIREKERLLEVRRSMNQNDRAALEKLLPDSIDNIRLIIDIDSIALRYGLVLKNLRFTGGNNTKQSSASTAPKAADNNISIGGNDVVGTVTFGFSVTARYEVFKQFLRDLEKSLRLLDITQLSIKATDETDFYTYDVTIKTYWLR
jgi:Tfp pilus assembly protein PilO